MDFLVGGDFNAHHYQWGGSYTCSEGRKLAEVVENLDLQCLNNGSPTRFATHYSQSLAIDITLSNCNATLTAHWEVIQESRGSDHHPIKIEVLG